MEVTNENLPTIIRTRIYLKDKPLIYTLGLFHCGATGLIGYFLYEATSVYFAPGMALFIGLLLFGTWYPSFRARNNVIEVTPKSLKVDDCTFKEIPWSDISHFEVINHFSTYLGRFVHLLIYVKNNKYPCKERGRFFGRQRADGGIFATDLYNYSEDHKTIFKDLSEYLERSRMIKWPENEKRR
ncbi:hypothetical protein [Marinobacter sp. CHS3-4]|uniref:hypothetical protein n=1 Tax=Marinobacter sp. CHS3-4 TaxID=3045174 RepID=UPI0024B58234|nr:hypothetical protein [Marinobacter sp. CHS3-4]MDI9244426.1 hypothetical protein [Marinobacter sp. CHS3-4]